MLKLKIILEWVFGKQGSDGVNEIHMALDRDQWWAPGSMKGR
jgi:hypothetical protein